MYFSYFLWHVARTYPSAGSCLSPPTEERMDAGETPVPLPAASSLALLLLTLLCGDSVLCLWGR